MGLPMRAPKPNLKLKRLRSLAGLSQRGLSARVGISRDHILKVEGGHSNLGHRAAFKIIDGLGPDAHGITVEDLLRGSV